MLEAVLGPRSTGLMPGFCTAGPGAVLFVEAVVFGRAWRSVLAAVQHAVLNFFLIFGTSNHRTVPHSLPMIVSLVHLPAYFINH